MVEPPSVLERPSVVEPVETIGRTRKVCFDAEVGYVETPLLWRPDLPAGFTVDGPAIIEEFGSTVPLHPGFTARVDDHRNIIVIRSERR